MGRIRSCFICGRTTGPFERHHIFPGVGMREKSEKYGLVVTLCHECHNEPPAGVHFNAENMLALKKYGQRVAMLENGWSIEDFRREFHKNYLEVEEK